MKETKEETMEEEVIAINDLEAFRMMLQNYIDAGNSKSMLSRESGVSRQTINRILYGEIYDPGYESVTRLYEVMDANFKSGLKIEEFISLYKEEEIRFFAQYRTLPTDKKRKIEGYMDCLYDS